MFRRLSTIAIVFTLTLAGCKSGSGSLAANGAHDALATTTFAHAVQTLAFTTGGARTAAPLALDGFLYAKHWLVCHDAQPGLFSATTTCSFNDTGRTYARANGWSASHVAGTCESCETWTVPVATARLGTVTEVASSDKTHAVASYDYQIAPNDFGGGLGTWMTRNPQAWCGPDPRAIGDWGDPRHGTANFVKSDGAWHADDPATSFAAFAIAVKDRPCSAV